MFKRGISLAREKKEKSTVLAKASNEKIKTMRHARSTV